MIGHTATGTVKHAHSCRKLSSQTIPREQTEEYIGAIKQMANENAKVFKKVGIDIWHSMGYDGSLGLTATAEKPVINDLTKDWWTAGVPTIHEGSEHALKTALVFHQFAPGRKLVYLPASQVKNEEGLYFGTQAVPYILKNGVDTLFCSMSHDPLDIDNYLASLPYLFYCNSAGNGGEKTYDIATRAQYIYGVGSLNQGTDEPNNSSSRNPFIDFAMYDGIYIPSSKGTMYPFNGTSCATPALIGMCACVNHFFIAKTGKPLLKEKMYQFIKDCCVDIYDKGKDDRTGWGLPVLPHPNAVDTEKYASKGGESDMTFTDTKGHWAEKAIDEISDIGLMNGYPSGAFKPDQFMTRAEVATVIRKLLTYTGNEK